MIEDFVAGVPVEVPEVRAGVSQDVEVADEHGVPAEWWYKASLWIQLYLLGSFMLLARTWVQESTYPIV